MLNDYYNRDSPCIGVCSTLFDNVCKGCGRSYMEVANWTSMNKCQKKEIWKRILSQGYPKK